jgi:DNA-binding transcriptional regulator YiaG
MTEATTERIKAIRNWIEEGPLRTWRKSQTPKVSIHQASAMLNVTPSTIQLWESGGVPRFENMNILAEVTENREIVHDWKQWLDKKPE